MAPVPLQQQPHFSAFWLSKTSLSHLSIISSTFPIRLLFSPLKRLHLAKPQSLHLSPAVFHVCFSRCSASLLSPVFFPLHQALLLLCLPPKCRLVGMAILCKAGKLISSHSLRGPGRHSVYQRKKECTGEKGPSLTEMSGGLTSGAQLRVRDAVTEWGWLQWGREDENEWRPGGTPWPSEKRWAQ